MSNTTKENIIVTGFGPFDKHLVNASWESVKLLPDEIEGINLIKQEIPVEYQHVQTNIPKLWEQHRPLLVVHVGVSSGAKKITVEKCAYKNGYIKCDSAGLIHQTGEASLDGENCILTEIDVDRICNRLNGTGKIEACLSEDAGRYLCEFIYYTSLNVDSSRTLFIHVPPLNEPYTAKELSEGLIEIIKCALEQILSNKEQCICVL
ncbi:pyroglutamyl-peptidase 1 [Diorhabda carinulata]|uniref:pyroglutamyl-peptidase 1 n=1 Tax=Diorhabda carinulata TaxID=1163345 RepID=UPI0025A2DE3E|nr:pyroglutamyl-peptidase 1 [Diorhabda carinulata]